jgi:hypothetical protein
MRLVAAALLIVLTAGCGAAQDQHLAVSTHGKAVLQDALDGQLARNWSCGSLRAAFRRLPEEFPRYSSIPLMIGRAAGRACDQALAGLLRGEIARGCAGTTRKA